MDVKTLCLGVLAERPMTGYEIKKLFDRGFRHFFVAGYGSIYPALAELAQAGLVTVQSVDQQRRPDKKVYRISESGLTRLTAELAATEPRHKVRSEFLALLYFAHLLPPARMAVVLDGMLRQWALVLGQDLAGDCATLTPGQRFARGYGRTVLSAAYTYVQQHAPMLLEELQRQAGDSDADLAAAAE
jgi:PadR family transcriptional regulator, regulatory protein AphA